MPLTSFQKEVLLAIVGNRSEASHVAGGMVLNASEESVRYSSDFDFFHDAKEALIQSSEADVAALLEAGFEVNRVEKYAKWVDSETFRKAQVRRADQSVEIDWAVDSAIRYFPIENDPVLGWRLHLFDMATNKALALSARSETRDYLDIIELSRRYPLAAILWAACGKDPAFNPLFLHEMVVRFARIRVDQLKIIQARDLDPIALKQEWTELHVTAREEITALADEQPDLPIGVAFVDEHGVPGWPRHNPNLRIHRPSVRGCWPTFHFTEAEAS